MKNHASHGCLVSCGSENRSDPLLWTEPNEEGEQSFHWNSSVAEQVNAQIHRLGPCVKKMSAKLNRFWMTQCMLCFNELALREKTLALNATFRP